MESGQPSQPLDDQRLLPPEEAFEWPRQAARQKNWEAATSRWEVLRKAYPDEPACWFSGANCLTQSAHFDQAEDLLTQARDRFPKNPTYFAESGFLHMKQGDLEAASDSFAKAREHLPNHFITWVWSSNLAEQMGDYQTSSKYALQATKCAPEQTNLYIQYAELSARAQKHQDAADRWQLALDKFPNLASARKGFLTAQAQTDQSAGPVAIEHPAQSNKHGNHQHPIRLIELIWTKAILSLHSEVRRNYLTFGWWVLEPMMYLAVYQVVFGVLLFRGGPDFLLFLIIGVVSWMWTMKCISGSSGSIMAGQSLMNLVGVPPIVFPSVALIQSTLKQIPVFIILIFFVIINGSSPGLHWLAIIPILIVHALLNISLSLAIAAITPIARDLQQIIPTGLTFLMFMSGVFYDYADFDPKWHTLFLLNPVAYILDCYREVFIAGVVPELTPLLTRGIIFAITCWLLTAMYKKLRYFYPRAVME